MHEQEINPWTTLSVERVYDNPWIEVTHRSVINPGGGQGIYGKVHFKNYAIGILPIDQEGNTWLVGQYRYTIEAYSWEIPEGGGKLDIPVIESAQRELLEETGISASNWTKILEMHLSNSVTDEICIAFVATGLSYGSAAPEQTESLVIRKIPFEELVSMVMQGEIMDAVTIATVLKAQYLISNGVLKIRH